jgi:hypothetical protein
MPSPKKIRKAMADITASGGVLPNNANLADVIVAYNQLFSIVSDLTDSISKMRVNN